MARVKNGRGHAKSVKTHSKEVFSIDIDSSISMQIHDFFKDAVNELYRPAAFVASTTLYDEIVARVPVKTGQLKNAIYRYREKSDIGERAIFYVGVNKRKAPHWSLIENGHFQTHQVVLIDGEFRTLYKPLANPKFVPAQPYFRPAVDAKLNAALQAGMVELKKRFERK